jgi:hypothetical protein
MKSKVHKWAHYTNLDRKKPALNTEQKQAYEIIAWDLDQMLARRHPPTLRMIMYGEGGTGKLKVIQTVTEAFASRNSSTMLVKVAYTGIAGHKWQDDSLYP